VDDRFAAESVAGLDPGGP